MKPLDSSPVSALREPRPPWAALLRSIRMNEVLILQGTPVMGAILALGAMPDVAVHTLGIKALLLIVANLLLVAHVFVMNDWAGIEQDLKDPMRYQHTFRAHGVGVRLFGCLGVVLGVCSVLVLALIGVHEALVGLGIVLASALYSLPPFQFKGRPVWNSVLHLIGGSLHFLLGYVAFAPISDAGVEISVFFGLVFAAGHLIHETRGLEGDLLNGIQTNAVRFGKQRCFAAAFALFSAAYLLLAVLSLKSMLPPVMVLGACFYPLHCWATWQALRARLSYQSLLRLQQCYRVMYALIGVLILGSTAWAWVPW